MIIYIKENFNFIIIILWFVLSMASGLYNYKHRDIYIQDMRDIVNLITQDVENGVYKPTFRYIGFPYYNMSYHYDSQKAAILSNINGNDDFVLIGEYIYDSSRSIKYCYGIYDISYSEMLDGSRISFYVVYSKQSDCYKKNS